MARMTWRPVMARVHSNWRSVPLWRGHQKKSRRSKTTSAASQQPWQTCVLWTR